MKLNKKRTILLILGIITMLVGILSAIQIFNVLILGQVKDLLIPLLGIQASFYLGYVIFAKIEDDLDNKVKKRSIIGKIGTSGNSEAKHLHYRKSKKKFFLA